MCLLVIKRRVTVSSSGSRARVSKPRTTISAIAKKHGVLHCCDATFGTPLQCKPIALGCDMSLHSTTKYFDGHNMTTVGECLPWSQRDLPAGRLWTLGVAILVMPQM